MNRLTRLVGSLLLAALLAVLGQGSARAEQSATPAASFSLSPVRYDAARPVTQSYFVYEAAPGQVIANEVRVVNGGTAAGTVRLYAVDATTGVTSGVVYPSSAEARTQVGSWISLGATELTLAPGEERLVTFEVRVPQAATAGQYVGGLVAEDVTLYGTQDESALQIRLQNRTVVAVQVNLPGAVEEALRITGVSVVIEQGYQKLLVGLANEGNQMLKPRGTIVVTDEAGQEVQRLTPQLDTILPGTTIEYPLLVERQALGAGQYRAMLEFEYGAERAVTSYESPVTVTTEQIAQIYEAAQQAAPAQAPAAAAPLGLSMPLLLGLGGGMLLLVLAVGTGLGLALSRRRQPND